MSAADPHDVQSAFRAGLLAEPATTVARAPGLAEAPAPFLGPNEAFVLAIQRLPGLEDGNGAHATGRILREIARLFDGAGATERVGAQFVANLRAALIAHRAEPGHRPWRAPDTIEMFAELYARVLGGGAELDRIRRHLARIGGTELLDEAPEPATAPGGPMPWYARWP